MTETFSRVRAKRAPAVIGRPVADPADWKAADLAADKRWVVHLDERDIGQMRAMAKSVRRSIGDVPNGLTTLSASKFDFSSSFANIEAIRHELKDGLGVVLVRGLPIASMDLLDAATIYWGIGRHLGIACSNNPEGDMLGHVTDLDKTQKDTNSRGYQTREAMAFHCDQTTLVGLLCVRPAKSGGQSKISSSVAVYNELLKRNSHAVALLSKPFCWTKHGEMNEGERGYYESPVFNVLDDMLCVSYGPGHIAKGHRIAGAPALTDDQRDALIQVEEIAEELHYGMELQPGDMQFLNNSVVLHSRTEYEDWSEPARKRLLWRLWLVAPDIRPSTPYIEQWAAGVNVRSMVARIVL